MHVILSPVSRYLTGGLGKRRRRARAEAPLKYGVVCSDNEQQGERLVVKSLVIVESPAKAKTISKILGQDYQVKASIGHVRDLPKKKLGVKVRKNFEPEYEILKDKEKIVEELREAAGLADKI